MSLVKKAQMEKKKERKHKCQDSQEASLIRSLLVFGFRLPVGASGEAVGFLVGRGPRMHVCGSHFEGGPAQEFHLAEI